MGSLKFVVLIKVASFKKLLQGGFIELHGRGDRLFMGYARTAFQSLCASYLEMTAFYFFIDDLNFDGVQVVLFSKQLR